MKAPGFWYGGESPLPHLLAPLTIFYRLGGAVRRHVAKPYRAKVPVICVGNVTAGGSGKTPTALALAAWLKQKGHKPAFVTRGYGGIQRGPMRVDSTFHKAADVGDEAMLLAKVAPVWIGRDRAAAIKLAEAEATHIILDDGLQNPNIAPDFALLVIDGAVGIGNGYMIPAGPLREPFVAAMRRVKAIVMIGEDRHHLCADAGLKPVLAAQLCAVIPASFPRDAKFLAFAGIGRPEKFYDLCRKEGLSLEATKDFADHHTFTAAELAALEQRAKDFGAHLLTTEKDSVRLPPDFAAKVLTFPVQLCFDDASAVERLLTR